MIFTHIITHAQIKNVLHWLAMTCESPTMFAWPWLGKPGRDLTGL